MPMAGCWFKVSRVAQVAALFFCVAGTDAGAVQQTRCGWYANPTPANIWLNDADGEWIISIQGREPAPGFWDAEQVGSFDDPGYWVRVNGYYGYGCACLDGDFAQLKGAETFVNRVDKVTALPLKRCESDPALSPEKP